MRLRKRLSLHKMQEIELGISYSTKNIPIPPERNYKLQLIEKTRKFGEKLSFTISNLTARTTTTTASTTT